MALTHGLDPKGGGGGGRKDARSPGKGLRFSCILDTFYDNLPESL